MYSSRITLISQIWSMFWSLRLRLPWNYFKCTIFGSIDFDRFRGCHSGDLGMRKWQYEPKKGATTTHRMPLCRINNLIEKISFRIYMMSNFLGTVCPCPLRAIFFFERRRDWRSHYTHTHQSDSSLYLRFLYNTVFSLYLCGKTSGLLLQFDLQLSGLLPLSAVDLRLHLGLSAHRRDPRTCKKSPKFLTRQCVLQTRFPFPRLYAPYSNT